MKCVAFKTYGMLGNKKYPDAYPAMCHEYESVEGEPSPYDAKEYLLMTVEEYKNYQQAMEFLYAEAVAKANLTKRPWYKFFSK